MSRKFYVLDEHGEPCPATEADWMGWSRVRAVPPVPEVMVGVPIRGTTTEDGGMVRTVFVGIGMEVDDVTWPNRLPLMYVTEGFRDGGPVWARMFARTVGEAHQQHERMLRMVRSGEMVS